MGVLGKLLTSPGEEAASDLGLTPEPEDGRAVHVAEEGWGTGALPLRPARENDKDGRCGQ